MEDKYVTRHFEEGRFIDRVDPVAYNKPDLFTQEMYDEYVENGFVIIHDFFDPETVDKAYTEAMRLWENPDYALPNMEPEFNKIRSMVGIHRFDIFKTISKKNDLVSIVSALLGSDIYIHQSRINYKAFNGSNGWKWHSDFETWHIQDGMPSMRALTALVPLTENDETNGALNIIKKSHTTFYSCPKANTFSAQENFSDQKEGVPCGWAIKKYQSEGEQIVAKVKPTDLVLFDCNVMHFSRKNNSDKKRVNLYYVFNSVDNRLVEPFDGRERRPEEMGTRDTFEILKGE